jgi:uncharacterized YccA/Bax inhibitor family protein
LVREFRHVAEEDAQLMADDWRSDSAKQLVGSLKRQLQRLDEIRNQERLTAVVVERRTRNRAIAAGLAFIVALAFVVLGFAAPSAMLFAFAFFGAPVLAGAAGGVTRLLLDVFRGGQSPDAPSEIAALSLGMIAGALSALLFVLAQSVTMDTIVSDAVAGKIATPLRTLVLFETIVAYIAGLTSEVVFAKLRAADVTDLSPIVPGQAR